jgi:hypothetical protein
VTLESHQKTQPKEKGIKQHVRHTMQLRDVEHGADFPLCAFRHLPIQFDFIFFPVQTIHKNQKRVKLTKPK